MNGAAMTPQDAPPRRRLNPFAFPSETDFRFALLIVLIVSVCLSNFYILFLTTPSSFQRTYFATLEECFRRFPPDPAPDLGVSPGLEGLAQQLERETQRSRPARECYQPVANRLIARIFAATAAVLLAAALIFHFAPRWTIGRNRLSPLTAEDVPEVNDYLDGLCAELQLGRAPSFLWNPLNATRSAFTFGNLSRQVVAMNMGLVSQFFSDREAFRAVVVHELAHLKNADLTKTQFANAIWIAFLLTAALPGLFLSLFVNAPQSGFGPLAWSRLWQVALMTALVFFARNGILRAREYYADVRASTYLARPDALQQVLAAAPPPRRWGPRRWFDTHPPSGRRIEVLNDTRPLFFATFEVAAITGVVMGIIYATNERWATSLGQQYFGQNAVLSLLLAFLLMGTIGLSIWRGTTAALLRPPARQRLGRIALGMGVGLFFGAQLIDMAGTLDFLGSADLASIVTLQIVLAVWAVFGAAVAYAVGLWSITCATAWSEVAAGRRSPRAVYAGWLLVASAVTAILIYPLTITFAMSQTIFLGGIFVLGGLFFMLSSIPAYLITSGTGSALFIGLWALPLAAWLFRRHFRPIRAASWGFLEPVAAGGEGLEIDGPQRLALNAGQSERLAFNIRAAVRGALVLAAVFAGMLALKWGVRFARGVVPGPGVEYNDLFGEAVLALSILLPVVLSAWVAARTRQLPVSHALFASFLLGALMSATNNVANGLIESGNPFATSHYYWSDVQLFWGIGLLVAPPVALLVRRLQGRIRNS